MDTEFAVKFRHANGTIHYTFVWAANAEALFSQVESTGAVVLLWAARRASDPFDARELLSSYE